MCKYPNLELLEYVFHQNLSNNEEWQRIIQEKIKENKYMRCPSFIAEMFKQTWGNTSCGIDITTKGEPIFAGQAFTDAYTTVVKEEVSGWYGIFFGESLAYIVSNPTAEFLNDLDNRRMRSKSGARDVY